jgi:AraC-like DNA-binding protein
MSAAAGAAPLRYRVLWLLRGHSGTVVSLEMTATNPSPRQAASSALPAPSRIVAQGRRGLRAFREQAASLSELSFPGAPDEFRFSLSGIPLGTAVLVEARVPQIHYERSARHLAAGDDRYMLVAYLRGESRMRIAGDDLTMSAGHIAVVDLTCPNDSHVVPPGNDGFAHHVTLLLPRRQLAPLLAAPDAVVGQVIRGDAGYGCILHGLLLDLWRQAASLDLAQSGRVIDAIAGLVAGALRPAPGCEREVLHAEHAARCAAIKRHLDCRADPADVIDIDALCRRFGISRASLYRMFQTDGGLVHYVRGQQLERARELLTSSAHRHRRIIDIAMQHGFHTESGFIRAFRRRFGISPAEARAARASAHAAASRAP